MPTLRRLGRRSSVTVFLALSTLLVLPSPVVAPTGAAARAANTRSPSIPRHDAAPSTTGYALVDSAGVVSTFGGAAYLGDRYDEPVTSPMVTATATPDHRGYWLLAADGGIFAYGDARYEGSLAGGRLDAPIVGMAADPAGHGYWLVAADGGIFAFGGAPYEGSTGGLSLDAPIVGMAADPAGHGYWLVAADGGIFAFGGAPYEGSTGGLSLDAPIVGMAADPAGHGYWLVAADGGIFAFGGAPYEGSTGGLSLDAPITTVLPTPSGTGYWLIASDGGVFTFGDATYEGSASDPLHPPLYTAVLSEHPPPTVGAILVTRGLQRAEAGPVRVEVMGDSLGFDTGYGLAAEAPQYGAVVQNSTIPGCGLALSDADQGIKWAHPDDPFPEWPACREWAQRDEAALAAGHPDVVALLAGYWECQRWYQDGVPVDLDDPTYAAHVEDQLLLFAHLVRAAGAQPVFVTAPYFDDGTPNALVDIYNSLVELAARADGDPVLDLKTLLDPNGAYASVVDGIPARLADGVHLTTQIAVQLLAPTYLPPLIRMGKAARL